MRYRCNGEDSVPNRRALNIDGPLVATPFFIAFTTGPDGALYGSLMYREYSTDPDYDNTYGIPTTELWRRGSASF